MTKRIAYFRRLYDGTLSPYPAMYEIGEATPERLAELREAGICPDCKVQEHGKERCYHIALTADQS